MCSKLLRHLRILANLLMRRKLKTSDLRFLAALLIVHAVFFVIAIYYRKIYNGDTAEYVYMALNIRDYFWFYCGNPVLPEVTEYLTLRPPGYSLFLMLVYLFAVNNWIVLILQNLISVFNIYYLRNTIRWLGYQKRYDWILLAFTLLYLPQFINANTIAPDILLQTFVLFYFCQFVLLVKLKKWKHGLLMSLALIGGLLVKPVLYPFAFIHCLVILWMALRIKDVIQPYLAAILPLIAVLLYGTWNYQRTGKLHFTSTQSFNAVFYQYKYIAYKEGNDSALVFLDNERRHMAQIPEFKDRYDYANRQSVQLLRENFLPYAWFHIKYSLSILLSPGKGELDMFIGDLSLMKLYAEQQPRSLWQSVKTDKLNGLQQYIRDNPSFPLIMVVLFFNVLKLGGLLLFFFTRNIDWHIRLFIAVLIGYFIFTAGPIANSRYFIPVSLIAAGCAAIAYQQMLWRFRNRMAEADPENE